jgi:glutamyl-tRNA synthetase
LEHCGKSGSRFDPEKARWFNAQYLKTKDNSELADLYQPILENYGVKADKTMVEKVCGLIKERATFVSDFWSLSDYFFVAPESFEDKAVNKFWKGENPNRLQQLRDVIATIEDFRAEVLEHTIHSWIEQNQYPMGQIMNTFRLAIVGRSMGPSMMEIAELIGRDQTIQRINSALDKLGNPA